MSDMKTAIVDAVRLLPASKTVEEIRSEIDDAIDRIWAEGVCLNMIGDARWPGHAIIEGLKQARFITGEPWLPDGDKFESWQRYARYIDPPGTWVIKDVIDV